MGKNHRTDPAWKYGKEIEKTGGDKKSYVYIECMFCKKTITGGVKRMKEHLACTHKNVAPCPGVPADVKQDEAAYKEIWNIIDDKWEFQLHRDLHAAAYYLNPRCQYADNFSRHSEVMADQDVGAPSNACDVNDDNPSLNFMIESSKHTQSQPIRKRTFSRKGKDKVTLQLVDEEDDSVEIESSDEEDDGEIRYDDDSSNNFSNSDDSADF